MKPVDNSHYGNTMSAPLILKSLCQHIHTEYNFLKTGWRECSCRSEECGP